LKKGFKFKIIACIVITFPVEYRKKLKSKENIKEIRKRLINLFKEWGYDIGLCRIHWYGETIKLKSKNSEIIVEDAGKYINLIENGQLIGRKLKSRKIKKTIDYCKQFINKNKEYKIVGVFNPHFNFLVEGEWILKDTLQKMKKDISNILDIKLKDTNFKYRYYDTVTKKIHIMKYVLRSTFLMKSWDFKFSEELKYFRNCICWGHKDLWNKKIQQWKIDTKNNKFYEGEGMEIFTEKKCPLCEKKVYWIEGLTEIYDFGMIGMFNEQLDILIDEKFFLEKGG
ncbi:MAG: hypothetical protein JSW62_04720, partial [Thermoplasmatales archaeon]